MPLPYNPAMVARKRKRWVRMPADEEWALVQRAQSGDVAAMNHLVTFNIGFLVAMSRRHVPPQLDSDEYLGAAAEGFMCAVRKYDKSRGAALTTYAAWWVMQAVMRELVANRGAIRVPTSLGNDENRAAAKRARNVLSLGRTMPDGKPMMDIADRSVVPYNDELSHFCEILRLLPEPEQHLLRSRAIGRTFNQLSQEYGVSRARVQQRVDDVYDRLRVCLEASDWGTRLRVLAKRQGCSTFGCLSPANCKGLCVKCYKRDRYVARKVAQSVIDSAALAAGILP